MSKAKCLGCNIVLESKHRHDWVTCGCDNETFIDGGDVYWRAGGKDLSMILWYPEEYCPVRVIVDDIFEFTAQYEGGDIELISNWSFAIPEYTEDGYLIPIWTYREDKESRITGWKPLEKIKEK